MTAMGQDNQGFLWIGTQTGLYRYDGARAQKMTEVEGLIGHYVVDLVIAPDGTPWFAGNRGIAYYKRWAIREPGDSGVGDGVGEVASQIFAVDSKGIVYALLFNHGVLRVDSHNPTQNIVLGEAEGISEAAAGIARAEDDSIWFTYGTHLAHVAAGSNEGGSRSGNRDAERARGGAGVGPRKRVVVADGDEAGATGSATHKLTMEKVAIGPADDVEGKPTLDRRGKLLVPSSTGLYWQRAGGTLAGDHGQAGNIQQRHSICDGRPRRNLVDWRDRGQGWTVCRACMNGRGGRRRKDCRTTRRGRRSGITADDCG